MTLQQSIRTDVPLAPLTTLQVGGAARSFIEVRDPQTLIDALAYADTRQLPVFILGGGSNLVVADAGFPGLVLHIQTRGITWEDQGGTVVVTAGAGEVWDAFVAQCVDRNWAGIECLSGIPGSVGGTPVQNVGAYGQEACETIVSVQVYDRREGRIRDLTNADCRFSYRASLFNTVGSGRYCILNVTYALRSDGKPTIRYADLEAAFQGRSNTPVLQEVRETVRAIRQRKGYLLCVEDPDSRSAGSFFKNPILTSEAFSQLTVVATHLGVIHSGEPIPHYAVPDGQVKIPAAWLIEQAGFVRGYRRGNVGLSSKHILSIINCGGAIAQDVIDLAREIQARVRQQFGVSLIPEPVFVGFDTPSPLTS